MYQFECDCAILCVHLFHFQSPKFVRLWAVLYFVSNVQSRWSWIRNIKILGNDLGDARTAEALSTTLNTAGVKAKTAKWKLQGCSKVCRKPRRSFALNGLIIYHIQKCHLCPFPVYWNTYLLFFILNAPHLRFVHWAASFVCDEDCKWSGSVCLPTPQRYT